MLVKAFVWLFVIVQNICGDQVAENMDIKKEYRKNKYDLYQVVPEVLSSVPPKMLKVVYPSGVTVKEGNELTPTQVKDIPTVTWEADPNKLYTLAMTDPDASFKDNVGAREFRHWLVVNIPGDKVEDGDVISGYFGSGPPRGTGLHRYVLSLFEQPGKIEVDESRQDDRTVKGRGPFSTENFACKYNLTGPIAANFYRSQFDLFVPKLHERMGIFVKHDSYERHNIVPGILEKAPEHFALIKYASGVSANEGNELTPKQVKDLPTVVWEADPHKLYTLIMTDPDALKDNTEKEWRHWLIINIPGSKIEDGDTISAYVSSAPSQNSGLHRYLFLIYQQMDRIEWNEGRQDNKTVLGRSPFLANIFAKKYNLELKAGNFYRAQYDDYVPIALSNIGI